MQVIAACVILLAIFVIVSIMAIKDREFEKEVFATKIVDDPEKLRRSGYQPLVNVVRCITSLHDPRPGAIIKNYRSKGWDVVLCKAAFDLRGRPVPECYSLWGKWELRAVK